MIFPYRERTGMNHSIREDSLMTWLFTIALGIGLGYFGVQMLRSSRNNQEEAENTEAEESTAAGSAETETRSSAGTRRLHKSVRDRKLAGVCGGIAEYFGTDSTFIRLAFAVLFLGWGTGLLAYILAALIMPEGEA